ncbi:hypothetical protein ACQCX2_09720 [Propionibacteriaceae bacterium Y1700]
MSFLVGYSISEGGAVSFLVGHSIGEGMRFDALVPRLLNDR